LPTLLSLSHEQKNGGDSDFEIAVKEGRQKCLLFHQNGHPPIPNSLGHMVVFDHGNLQELG